MIECSIGENHKPPPSNIPDIPLDVPIYPQRPDTTPAQEQTTEAKIVDFEHTTIDFEKLDRPTNRNNAERDIISNRREDDTISIGKESNSNKITHLNIVEWGAYS